MFFQIDVLLFSYLLFFARIVIGLVFAFASFGKIKDFSSFKSSIKDFDILPCSAVSPAAIAVITLEVVTVVFSLIGGRYLLMSFILASLLLTVFCYVLMSALLRKIRIPCNCFGQSDNVISRADVWRNVTFIICSIVGLVSTGQVPNGSSNLGLVQMMPIVLAGALFVTVVTHLNEIARVMHFSDY